MDGSDCGDCGDVADCGDCVRVGLGGGAEWSAIG